MERSLVLLGHKLISIGPIEVITIRTEGDMNVCANYHGNPSNSFFRQFTQNLMVASEEKSGDTQCQVRLGDRRSLYKFANLSSRS